MLRILTTFALAAVIASTAYAQRDEKLLPKDFAIEKAFAQDMTVKLKEENVTPARAAEDAAILRRLTLDLNGRVPTLVEMEDYLKENSPDKKAKVVDRLLASPAFNRHGAQTFFAFMQYSDGR